MAHPIELCILSSIRVGGRRKYPRTTHSLGVHRLAGLSRTPLPSLSTILRVSLASEVLIWYEPAISMLLELARAAGIRLEVQVLSSQLARLSSKHKQSVTRAWMDKLVDQAGDYQFKDDKREDCTAVWVSAGKNAYGGVRIQQLLRLLSGSASSRGQSECRAGLIASVMHSLESCQQVHLADGALRRVQPGIPPLLPGSTCSSKAVHSGWSYERVQAAISAGSAVCGILDVNSYDTTSSTVKIAISRLPSKWRSLTTPASMMTTQEASSTSTPQAGSGSTIRVSIAGKHGQGRSIHGDTVAVLLHSQDCVIASTESVASGAIIEGTVIAVLKPGRLRAGCIATVLPDQNVIAATGQRVPSPSSRYVRAYPMDRRLPPIRLVCRDRDAVEGQRLVVRIDGWQRDSSLPHGHVIASLGPALDRDTEVRCILHQHDIASALQPYPEAALRCLPVLPIGAKWTIGLETARMLETGDVPPVPSSSIFAEGPRIPKCMMRPTVMGRSDLRLLPACSIDPPGCKDIDDSLSICQLENGNLSVGVHIADVTHFVKSGSPLDTAAQVRATTVYLTDRRLDMLPPMLSTHLCSLRARADRMAVSVMWELAPNREPSATSASSPPESPPQYHIVRNSTWCGLSVIRSTHALTYDQAQRLADGDPPNSEDGSMSSKDRHLTGIQGSPWSVNCDVPQTAAEGTGAPWSYLDPVEGGVCGAPVHPSEWDALRPRMKNLLDVSRWLRGQRDEQGGVALAGQEVQIELGTEVDGGSSDIGNIVPLGLEEHDHCEMHEVVADLMIFANETIARVLFCRRPMEALLRWHAPPSKAGLQEVTQLAQGIGISEADTRDISMRDLLRLIRGELHRQHRRDMLDMVSDVAARSMQEAQYGSTGDAVRVSASLSSVNELVWMASAGLPKEIVQGVPASGPAATTISPMRHFGLGLDFYTHFTSPIRRYADVVVHRQLRSILFGTETEHDALQALHTPSKNASSISATSRASRVKADAAHQEKTRVPPKLTSAQPSLTTDILGSALDDSSDSDSDSDSIASGSGSGVADGDGGCILPSDCDRTHIASASDSSVKESELMDPLKSSAGPYSVLQGESATGFSSMTNRSMTTLSDHLNSRTRQAKDASRDCDELFLTVLAGGRPQIHAGSIARLHTRGLSVFVPELARRVYVPLTDQDGTPALARSYFPSPAQAAASGAAGLALPFAGLLANEQEPVRFSGCTLRSNDHSISVHDKSDLELARFELLQAVTVIVGSDLKSVKARAPQLVGLLVSDARVVCKTPATLVSSCESGHEGQTALPSPAASRRHQATSVLSVQEALRLADEGTARDRVSVPAASGISPIRVRSRMAFGCAPKLMFKRRPNSGLQYLGATALAPGSTSAALGGTGLSAAALTGAAAQGMEQKARSRQVKLSAAKLESMVKKQKRQGQK